MKINHREWTIDSVPQKQGRHWHAWVEVARGPWEHESLGQIYHFTDMLRAIVGTPEVDYDSLIGLHFDNGVAP